MSILTRSGCVQRPRLGPDQQHDRDALRTTAPATSIRTNHRSPLGPLIRCDVLLDSGPVLEPEPPLGGRLRYYLGVRLRSSYQPGLSRWSKGTATSETTSGRSQGRPRLDRLSDLLGPSSSSSRCDSIELPAGFESRKKIIHHSGE